MLIQSLNVIGNNLYYFRKSKGMTQIEVAEKADISDRTYADIERGSVTMRVDTLIKICSALCITPNDILLDKSEQPLSEAEIITTLKNCSDSEQRTALNLLNVYLQSLK